MTRNVKTEIDCHNCDGVNESTRATSAKRCVCCKKIKRNLINHHVNYSQNKTVSVCNSCHRTIHNDQNHPLYPTDNIADSLIRNGDGETVVSFRLSGKEISGLKENEITTSLGRIAKIATINYLNAHYRGTPCGENTSDFNRFSIAETEDAIKLLSQKKEIKSAGKLKLLMNTHSRVVFFLDGHNRTWSMEGNAVKECYICALCGQKHPLREKEALK